MTDEEFHELIPKHPGNRAVYDVSAIAPDADSPLQGKRVIFLGSSVTEGLGALGQSFVDMLATKDGLIPLKEAVSGTTLVDEPHDGMSYVERMKALDPEFQADLFVCQLSTNDASQNKTLGEISNYPYDCSTIAGALQEIVTYARATWKCPIVFYTGPKYNSPLYGQMVGLLHQVATKEHVQVINLWNDDKLNQISGSDYELYMVDEIHPTKAGYKCWVGPAIEYGLIEIVSRDLTP